MRQAFLKPDDSVEGGWRVPKLGELCCQRTQLADTLDASEFEHMTLACMMQTGTKQILIVVFIALSTVCILLLLQSNIVQGMWVKANKSKFLFSLLFSIVNILVKFI